MKNKSTKGAEPFFKKLLQDPAVRLHYEIEKSKTELAMAVKTARLRKKLTQVELAKKVGTSQSVIARIEGGTDSRIPTLRVLARIAEACGATLEISFQPKKAA
jgi:ribosome-binding protein aMBF1 (putative translation factor)